MELKRVAIDTPTHVFTIHGVDLNDRVMLRRELRRGQLEAFMTKLPATEVVGLPRFRGRVSLWFYDA